MNKEQFAVNLAINFQIKLIWDKPLPLRLTLARKLS